MKACLELLSPLKTNNFVNNFSSYAYCFLSNYECKKKNIGPEETASKKMQLNYTDMISRIYSIKKRHQYFLFPRLDPFTLIYGTR